MAQNMPPDTVGAYRIPAARHALTQECKKGLRAECESISVEYDDYEGCSVTDYIFPDGSKLRVCAGHMESID